MSKHLTRLHKKLTTHACNAGHCPEQDKKIKKDKLNQKNRDSLEKHYKYLKHKNLAVTPSTFYTSGIYGTNNCNKLRTLPSISPTEKALKSVDSVLDYGGEATHVSDMPNQSSNCSKMETFGGYYESSNGFKKRHVYIILLILIIICLIMWVYYTIRMFLHRKSI